MVYITIYLKNLPRLSEINYSNHAVMTYSKTISLNHNPTINIIHQKIINIITPCYEEHVFYIYLNKLRNQLSLYFEGSISTD